MKLTLSPIRMDLPLTLSRHGSALTFNDETVDLDAGETIWWILAGEKIAGEWELLIFLPHGATAPEETRFPDPIILAGDGPVDLPPFDVMLDGAQL